MEGIIKGYTLINEIRGEISSQKKILQKRRASFFFRKGKRKHDFSKISQLRMFHKEMVTLFK